MKKELTVGKIKKRTRLTLRTIDKIEKLYAVALEQAARLNDLPRSSPSARLRARSRLSRTRVKMSQLARSIGLHPLERKRLTEKLRHAVEEIDSLGRESSRLERRAGSRGENLAALRKDLRSRRSQLKALEESSEVGLTALKRAHVMIRRGEADAERAKKELTEANLSVSWCLSPRSTPTGAWSFLT